MDPPRAQTLAPVPLVLPVGLLLRGPAGPRRAPELLEVAVFVVVLLVVVVPVVVVVVLLLLLRLLPVVLARLLLPVPRRRPKVVL